MLITRSDDGDFGPRRGLSGLFVPQFAFRSHDRIRVLTPAGTLGQRANDNPYLNTLSDVPKPAVPVRIPALTPTGSPEPQLLQRMSSGLFSG